MLVQFYPDPKTLRKPYSHFSKPLDCLPKTLFDLFKAPTSNPTP